MTRIVSGGGEGGGGLKKGPWTQTEDTLLREHVERHGEGNWNAVRRGTGLQRCGKSCRLRWANHLRPNLRKGPFSPEEEHQILLLHGLLGNKWARISSKLRGRTDNEIKNYWNTRLKRRQRAGQPLYPPEIEREIAYWRAHNLSPFPDGDANSGRNAASLPTMLLFDGGNPFALPPPAPSPSGSATASQSPMINQNYPLLNQMQGMQLLHVASHQAAAGGGCGASPSPQLVFHLDGAELGIGYGRFGSAVLPPLPARAHELPSNQFDTASCGSGAAELVDFLPSVVLAADGHDLPRSNPGMLRVVSMPELMCREPTSRLFHGGAASDVTSQYPPGEDPYFWGKWDCVFEDVKPAKRRAASEVEFPDMFGTVGPCSIRTEWFNAGGGSTAPSTIADDDESNSKLDMQQFMSSLPQGLDEPNWNE